MEFDFWVFYAINHAPHSPVLDFVARIIHYATRGGLVYYPFFALLLFSRDAQVRLVGIVAGTSALLTYSMTDLILKYIIQRGRPFQELMDVILVAQAPNNSSFPSGQTAIAFAVATAWLLCFPKKIISYGVLFFAVLVSLDRMYMGHHYPSDIVGGAAVGVAFGVFVFFFFRRRVLRS